MNVLETNIIERKELIVRNEFYKRMPRPSEGETCRNDEMKRKK